METLTATVEVSDKGTITVAAPSEFKGKTVEIKYTIKRKYDGPRDKNGWPVGFWEWLDANRITDPKFIRYPQPEAEPSPSFE